MCALINGQNIEYGCGLVPFGGYFSNFRMQQIQFDMEGSLSALQDSFNYNDVPPMYKRIEKVTMRQGTILHHSSDYKKDDENQNMMLNGGVAKNTWFSPNPCQSIPFGCLKNPVNAYNYIYRTVADMDLIKINYNYPFIKAGKVGVTKSIYSSMSGNIGTDDAVKAFCDYAQSVGAYGWRQSFDQDEVMLCSFAHNQINIQERNEYACGNQGTGFITGTRCSGIAGSVTNVHNVIDPDTMLIDPKRATPFTFNFRYHGANVKLKARIICNKRGRKFSMYDCDC